MKDKEINHIENIMKYLHLIVKEWILVKSRESFDSNFRVPEHIWKNIRDNIWDSLDEIKSQNKRLIERNEELEELFEKFSQLQEDVNLIKEENVD